MFQQIDALVSAFQQGKLSRRELIARIGVFAAACSGGRAFADDQPAAKPTFSAKSLNHIALNVSDVRKSRDFYKQHLGLSVLRESDRSCFMRVGDHFLALFKDNPAGMDHYCYTIGDYDAANAVTTLEKAELKPVRHGNRVYFDDPDGITVQVSAVNDWRTWG